MNVSLRAWRLLDEPDKVDVVDAFVAGDVVGAGDLGFECGRDDVGKVAGVEGLAKDVVVAGDGRYAPPLPRLPLQPSRFKVSHPSEHQLEKPRQNLIQRHDCQQQGQDREQCRRRQSDRIVESEWDGPHLVHGSKTASQISERLNVA